MPDNSIGTPDLDRALLEVMKAVDSVPKNGRNEYHQYDYATIADVLRTVRGKLAEQGVIVLTSIHDAKRTGELTEVFTTHTFVHTATGQSREVKGYGQGADKTDKGAYKARSGAQKYLHLDTFLIPTGDDPERDDPPTGNAPQNGQGSAGQRNGAPPPQNGKRTPEGPKKPNPNEASKEQQDTIKKLAQELGISIQREILPKLQITWPPDKQNAEKIIARLNEIRAQR